MFARVSHFRLGDQDINESVRLAQEQIVPQAQSMPGFLGLHTLVNRETGKELTITFWESEDAMRASEAEANRLRQEAAELTDEEVVGVERYEVVLRVGL